MIVMTVNHTPPMVQGLISTARAMEIAAYWQSPGSEGIGMAQFASTGTVTDALLEDIAREVAEQASFVTGSGTQAGNGMDLLDLRALDAYVNACTVPVWVVGRNVAGYLPESDVTAYLTYAEAVEAHRSEVEEAPEEFFPEDECECVDGGELCDFHSMEAEVGAYLRDDAPSVSHGRVYETPRECSIALRPDHLPLPTVFFVAHSVRVVADFLAEQSI